MDSAENNFDGGTQKKETLSTTHETSGASQAPKSHLVPTKSSTDRSWFVYALIAVGLAFFIRFFIAAPYVVNGSSMEPTFYDWHYLIVDRLTYNFEKPMRGDVIVLDSPQMKSRALIKRIIGLPGDTVEISGTNPTVTIINASNPKGFTLSEPYIDPQDYGGATNINVTLGPDQYFVLGDNRKVSLDSRYIGPIPQNDIVGRVLVRLYPFNEMGFFPGQARFAQTTQ